MRKGIEGQLGLHAPAVINVILSNGETRTLRPPAQTRKKWTGILGMLARMEWVRLELLDRSGGILEMIDNEDAAERAPEPVADPMLRTMISAQREALTWQDKSVRAALDTCVQVMGQLHESVTMVVELHRQERAQQASMMRELEAAVAAASESRGDDQPQTELLKAFAPMLLQKLIAGAKPGNGAT